MDEHPVPPPTRQVLQVAPQDLSEDDEVEWLQTLPNAPQVDAPRVLLSDDNIFGEDSESEDVDGEDLDGDPYNDHCRIPGQFRYPCNINTLPAAPRAHDACVLLAEDCILCDADYDSESEDLDDEDLDGEPLDGEHPYIPGEYRRIPWNRDTQVLHMVGDDALARDDDIWEQPSPDFHHDSPLAVLLPRAQSQEELDRMHHLGAAYF